MRGLRLMVVLLAFVVVLGACSGGSDGAIEPAPQPAVTIVDAAELPTPRTEVAGARFGADRILVAGGFLADGSASDLAHVYDPGADTWTEVPRLPEPLHHAVLVAARGRTFLVGGFRAAGESDRVWSLAPGESEWRQEPALRNSRGALGAAATEDGTIVAFGGVSGGQVVATTEVLRLGATAWEPGPDMDEAREHLAATAIDGRVYAIAGRVGSLESNKRTVESWDPGGREGSWRREPALDATRGGTAAGGRCVAGGEEPQGTIASIECLEPDGGSWRTLADMKVARHGLAVVELGGDLHVIAGGDQPGLFVTGAHEVVSAV